MLDIYICDDNKKHCEAFQKFVEEVLMFEEFDMAISLVTQDPHQLLEKVKSSQKVSVYFLDVDLSSEMTGLQLASEVRKYDPRGYIVFISSHAEMSSLTFQYKLEALDYIIKDKYINIKNRIHECLVNINEKHINYSAPQKKEFVMMSKKRLISEPFENIILFEISENVHRVIMKSFERSVEFYASIKEVEQNLDERFYRCNSACIVNKVHIKEIDVKNRIIYMKNNIKCYPSVRLIKGLLYCPDISYIKK